MDKAELQKHFKAGQFNVELMMRDAPPLDGEDLLKLLQIMTGKGVSMDSADVRLRMLLFTRLVERRPDKALFVPIVKILRDTASQFIQGLAALLPKVNNPAGHEELVGLLRHVDPAVRRAAAGVIKEVGGTSAFDAVHLMLGERSFGGRMEAMDVLVHIGRHHAAPALAKAIALGSDSEKLQALKYLGDLAIVEKDREAAVKALQVGMRDASERIATAAIAAFSAVAREEDFLHELEPALDSSNLNIVRAAIDALSRARSAKAVEALERKLRMGPNAVRLQVLATLEAIGTDAVVGPIVSALNSKHLPVRTRAAEALSALALGKKIDLARVIMWLLRSRDVEVRRMAADIARKVGDPTGELAPKLLGFLRDEDWWVRERVMDALAAMAGRQLTRHMVSYLQDPSDVIRRYAIDALQRIGDPASAGALVRAAQTDADWWVRERAVEALAAMKDARLIPYVVDIMNKQADMRMTCASALAAMGAKEAAPHIAAFLPDADLELKIALLDALKTLDDAGQAGAVAALEQDDDHRVRARVHEILTRWKRIGGSEAAAQASAKALSTLERLLIGLARADGDDLIIAGGQCPYVKKVGRVSPLITTVFTPDQVRAILTPVLTGKQIEDLDNMRDVDFSVEVKSEGLRFRANVFNQAAGLSGVFRIIKNKVPAIEEIGVPPVVLTFGDFKHGLVLVGGPTGSGKSTTMAALVDYINRSNSRHIMTIEDPVEVVHSHKKSLVNQREIGAHTLSFSNALRGTLRQDPDVILVGEMRDHATISFALSAAETGHLVLGTVHTNSADACIDRLINAFPPGQQPQARSLLADCLRAVMCQHLLRRKGSEGRVLASEILINTDGVANLIRKGKTFQIASAMTTGRDVGMQSMDSDLDRLLREGKITAEEAYLKAANKKLFEALIAPAEGAPATGAGGQGGGAGGPAARVIGAA